MLITPSIYQFEIPGQSLAGDFCIAEFFKNNQSTLLIHYSNLTTKEVEIVNCGKIEVGFTTDNDLIYLYWLIDGQMDFITPFDARSYADHNIAVNTSTIQTLVTINLVEANQGLLIATRMINLPDNLILELIEAINHQLSGKAKPIYSHNKKWDVWPVVSLKQFFPTFYSATDA